MDTVVYYQDNSGYLVPVMRSIPETDGIAKATLSLMVQSPYNDMEAARQQEKIASLQAENQSLKFAASQSNQNAYLTATMDANVAELIRRINPTPVPAYTVPAPYPYSGCGTYNYSGCGCNSCC